MLEIIIVAITIILDQATKNLSVNYLKPTGSVSLIDGVFNLTYVENRGAAFGILQDKRWFFIFLTIIISIAIIYFLFSRRNEHILLRFCLAMILGGAIGNLIDRILLGYVVDMLHFSLINFPVFNIADCAVVIGTVLLGYYLLFIDNTYNKPLNH